MTTDTDRNRVMVFGGSLAKDELTAETWEFDGVDWELRDDGTGPTPRTRMALAYDSARRETLLFGGYDDADPLGDFWAWNGREWTRHNPEGVKPEARVSAAMAFDPKRGRAVLFGGNNLSLFLADTWEWDGTAWYRVADGKTVPSPRHSPAMAWLESKNVIVLFGGMGHRYDDPTGENPELDDTWSWDGSNWRKLALGIRPRARVLHQMVYCSDRGTILLFGGSDGRNPLGDLWEFDGSTWRELRADGASPKPRWMFGMADLPGVGLVVYGGSSRTETFGETWILKP